MNEPVAENMIQVAVCIEQQYRFQWILGDKIWEFIPFLIKVSPRVDDHAGSGGVVKQVGILLQWIESENFNV